MFANALLNRSELSPSQRRLTRAPLELSSAIATRLKMSSSKQPTELSGHRQFVFAESDKPVPGVVGSCGHSDNGKAAEAYQSFAQGLARQGYACLIFDPIGQGERLQYVKENGKSRHGGACKSICMVATNSF